ncbi:uncharacterized protein TNCV_4715711 [Trichonephila clavipes]|nr:uncharacterized protein TNCV_4715711 [Trichonephila clavipes]
MPASSLKCRAQPNVIRRSFEPYDQMLYHRTILEPHTAYPIPAGTNYIVLTVQKTAFGLDIIPKSLLSQLIQKGFHVGNFRKMKKFDQTPYKLPPPIPIHVPAEKRPLKEKSLPFSKKRVRITPVMRRVSRRPELPKAPVQIPHVLDPVQIPLVPQPHVQILDVPEPVQIPVPHLCRFHMSQSHLCRFQCPTCADFTCPRATCADSTCPTITCADSTCPTFTSADSTCARTTCADSSVTSPTVTCADSTCARTTCADSTCIRTCADSTVTSPTATCADSTSPRACADSTCLRTCADSTSPRTICADSSVTSPTVTCVDSTCARTTCADSTCPRTTCAAFTCPRTYADPPRARHFGPFGVDARPAHVARIWTSSPRTPAASHGTLYF